MTQAILVGLSVGATSALLLAVFTRRALPRIRTMRRLERFGWLSYLIAVYVGSLAGAAWVGRSWSGPSHLHALVLAWVAPIAIVLVDGVRRTPRAAGAATDPATPSAVLRTVVWVQLVLILAIAAGAVWVWMTDGFR